MSKNPIAKEITQYISDINRIYKTGDASELSYRHLLQQLLEQITIDLDIIQESKKISCGRPDYFISKNKIPIGFIETKDVGKDLNRKEDKEQFDRYRKALNNLIITDYLTFQFFEEGNLIKTVTIAKVVKNNIIEDKTKFEEFEELIKKFCGYSGLNIHTSEQLSKIMAAKARLLAKSIEDALHEDENNFDNSNPTSALYGQLKGFRQMLIGDIKNKEFADIYAQTIAYGMFTAKLNAKKDDVIDRYKVARLIPKSNPFLCSLFQYIENFGLDNRISWVIDDLADLFNYVAINEISKEFDKTDDDPMIHFFETFLAEYDPVLRKCRGVWYTPQPIVKFIVQAVDDILKQDFNISQGLSDSFRISVKGKDYVNNSLELEDVERTYHRVQILDPATGTGTFLAEVVRNIYRNFEKSQKGMWNSYVKEHLIPRLNGFEILMASYAVAHLKLDLLLQKKTGYKFSDNERLHIYLTNTLEEARIQEQTPFVDWLLREANEACHIKNSVPVMVVLGNPPYSGISQNNGKWISDLIQVYKLIEKERIKERKHWLNDDYVKFIRYGQNFVEKTGEGVLAYINNHSFLDNPTFRGMRWQLLKTFDKIYIIDLHGNAKKKETELDGSKDENVFDIQQGVSINIFIKTKNKQLGELAQVFHIDKYGKRESKYKFLLENKLFDLKWKVLEPKSPYYFFVPKSEDNKEEYEKGFAVNEIFNGNVTGIVTARDSLVIDIDKKTLLKRIQKFCDSTINDDEIRNWLFPNKADGKYLAGDSRGWKLSDARKLIRNEKHEELIKDINYRPFDIRKIYYTPKMVDWGRENVMRNFLKGENVGLVVARQSITDNWSHVQVSNSIIDNRIHYSNKGIPILIPLYLYLDGGREESGEKRPDIKAHNLNEKIIKEISQQLDLTFTEEKEEAENTFAPIDILDYIYAVLYSPTYRERYKEFLKIDFPRVPYPENVEQFWKLVELGGKLRHLHLMEDVKLQDGMADFNIEGSCIVEKVEKDDTADKVYINDAQYFDNVPLVAWNFYIGGYQPAQKWLKDRKGRELKYEDILHYRKIIKVLVETEEVMREIDEIMISENKNYNTINNN